MTRGFAGEVMDDYTVRSTQDENTIIEELSSGAEKQEEPEKRKSLLISLNTTLPSIRVS